MIRSASEIIRNLEMRIARLERQSSEDFDPDTKRLMSRLSGINLRNMIATVEQSSHVKGSWASSFAYVMVRQGSDWDSAHFFILKKVSERGKKPYWEILGHGDESKMYRAWQDLT